MGLKNRYKSMTKFEIWPVVCWSELIYFVDKTNP